MKTPAQMLESAASLRNFVRCAILGFALGMLLAWMLP